MFYEESMNEIDKAWNKELPAIHCGTIKQAFWKGWYASKQNEYKTSINKKGISQKEEGSVIDMTADEMAKLFHDTYELLAPAFGYKTRKRSRVPWSKVPERNRALMVAVCQTVINTKNTSGKN